ncbi:MAG TPA: TonB-dependent receptor [Gemmatimonadales bacterium]|nr:TonB-dependent receptor [Gemmatimonadales bacterium]
MLAVIALGALALAQDTAARPLPDSAAYILPDIPVLGDRQPTSLFEAPLAATEVESTDYFGRNGTGLDAALRLVPGVVAQSRAGSHDIRIVIRGFGARGAGDRSNSGTARGVRVLVDGFPETEPDGRTAFDGIDLSAIERIEVVRSNVSSTWGNAAGGVVSVSTVPASGQRTAEGGTMVGSFGLQRYVVRASAPVGQGTAYATLIRSVFDGWRAHSASDRVLLNAGASTFAGAYTQLAAHFLGTINDFRIPGPLTAEQVASNPEQANATYRQRDERRLNRVGRLGLTARHDRGAWGVTATAYAQPKDLTRSERGTYREFNRWHFGGSVVGRGGFPYGESVRGRITIGLDEAYQNGPARFWSLSPDGRKGDALQTDQREGANNVGIFVQHQLELGERWSLIIGARYDVIRYTYEDEISPQLDDARSFAQVTPKLAINYRPGAAHSVYASMGGGVEAPAGNETDPASTFGQDTITGLNPLLDPITSTTWEVGTRQAIARGTGAVRGLSYDAALYYNRVRNEIVPYRGGRFFFTAGRVRRMGAELGLRADLAGGWSVASALTWSDNKYLQYVVDSVHYGVPGATADYAGNRVVGVPDVTAGAQLAWEPAFAPIRTQLALDASASYWADDANRVRVPGYGVWSVSFGLRQPVRLVGGLGVRGALTVANLFDRAHVASAFLNPDVVDGVPVAFEPGLPRHVLVSATLQMLENGAARRP